MAVSDPFLPAPLLSTSVSSYSSRMRPFQQTWIDRCILPSPADIGLDPARFPSWRPLQEHALNEALSTTKRFVIVNAPTGFGKTAFAAAFAAMTSVRAIYTCHSLTLQDQAQHDIPYARTLKGRSNYPTLDHPDEFPEYNCADCDKHAWGQCPICKDAENADPPTKHCNYCSHVGGCPYMQAKIEALSSPLLIANNSYLLLEANYAGALSNWPLMVMDEGDLLEGVLMDYASVSLGERVMADLKIEAPKYKGTSENAQRKVEEWVPWFLDSVLPEMEKRVAELEGVMKEALSRGRMAEYRTVARRCNGLSRLLQSCWTMVSDLIENPSSWVRVDESGGLTWKPVRVSRLAQDALWRHSKRFLIMSATVISRDQLCRDLGIPADDVTYIDLPSTFPAERRPIIYLPSGKVTQRTMESTLPALVRTVDDIAVAYPRSRILVHCHTFALAGAILQGARVRARMCSYARGGAQGGQGGAQRARGGDARWDRERALAEYLSREDAILVAPSLERGLSLENDLCRVQVVCKVPYPYLGDRQVSTRFHQPGGKAWYAVQTARSLVQMTGRAVRSEDDWAHTYILDAQFLEFLKRHGYLIPSWWRDALDMQSRRILGLPAA